jgi:hypothetical protein
MLQVVLPRSTPFVDGCDLDESDSPQVAHRQEITETIQLRQALHGGELEALATFF